MFTGIVTDIGRIAQITTLDEGLRFRIATTYDPSTIDIGASIACSGICLTVVALPEKTSTDSWFEVEAWEEALRLTTIGSWQIDKQINLERSLKLGDEMGGHLVSGHVDGTAEIIKKDSEGEATRFTIKVDEKLARFIAQKGSVCLDGTSLTVNKVERATFDVLIIRHTLEVTTWGQREVGDILNIEIDQLARYAARLAEFS
ncbi:riboflavin synthase [Bartonella sp. HY329]|uniref:riboflavin synthase n=1 Tax=unclassified Bartonella TaxID=2645622 RepID=UPI0021C89159|nr:MULTISPECIES: riboflavin synthase [unclassified Bartonella]UXM93946.1 riboflavin synthase [Bartonella sp. HY329]UXN08267.1 riboflavin synthase [Bartonella sp. HY328]